MNDDEKADIARGGLALIDQAENDDLNKIRVLLQRGADINGPDQHGCTPLIIAAFQGSLLIVGELMKHENLDVIVKNDDGETALIVSVLKGHINVAREMLKHNRVDVNAQGSCGTAFVMAAFDQQFDFVLELLNGERVDVNAKGILGSTALILIIQHGGHRDVVRELLKHKMVDVNADSCNYTISKFSFL